MLDNKTVFITGAGGGIGSETAKQCAYAGARVVLTDIDSDGVESVAESIRDSGGEAVAHGLDVTESEQFEDLVGVTAEEYGLDVIVNNAGIGHDAAYTENLPADARDRVMSVNINGVWNGCQAALPIMKEQGHGSIINVASLAAIIGLPKQAAYSLTKGAIVSFTRAVAVECGPSGVRANAVCPGFIDAGVGKEYFDSADDPQKARERSKRAYPLRRLGEAEEVAAAIRFLASDDSSYITGNALKIDGGYSVA